MLNRRAFVESSLLLTASLGHAAPAEAATSRFTIAPSRIYAHRGFGSLGAPNAPSPENTLRAFRHAVALGVLHLETDVQATADGVPVLLHDATLDRTTDGEGAVNALPYDRLAALNAAARFAADTRREAVPTFAQYLALCRETGATAVPELKSARTQGEIAALLALADAAGLAGRVIWQSRRLRTLEIIARTHGPAARIALIRNDLKDLAEFAQLPGEKTLVLRATTLLEGRVRPAEVTAAGVRLVPWTVNQSAQAASLLEGGCDFILSDGPV